MLYGDPALRRRWGMTLFGLLLGHGLLGPGALYIAPTVRMLQPTRRRGRRPTRKVFCSCARKILTVLSPVLRRRFEPTQRRGRGIITLAWLTLIFRMPRHAVTELQLADSKAPARAEIRLALGIAQEALGENGKAEMSYRAAYALDPKSPEIIRHLAAVLGKEKQSGAAITYWREAVALAPYDPEIRLSLATALMDDGQNDAAAVLLHEMVQQNPKSGLALLNLGAVLYRQQKYAEAADAYRGLRRWMR